MYGVACAALGMLSTMCTGLAIDAYGPIADNAGGIAEMAGMGDDIREKTDALDAAGNTTAAIGKGFAIGSAALVSLALFGAYATRCNLDLKDTSILDPKVFAGLLIGAMLPYWFSAMTMKSVGKVRAFLFVCFFVFFLLIFVSSALMKRWISLAGPNSTWEVVTAVFFGRSASSGHKGLDRKRPARNWSSQQEEQCAYSFQCHKHRPVFDILPLHAHSAPRVTREIILERCLGSGGRIVVDRTRVL